MKKTNKLLIAAAAISMGLAAGTANAGVNGWLDGVNVDMTDTAFGWVCMNEDAFNTPEYGSLDVYLHAPADKGGEFYDNFKLQPNQWGYFKKGINAAGYCGTDPYVSFKLDGWFSEEGYGPNTIYIYFRDKAGHLTLIGGSGLDMSKVGMNP